jgi:NAD(P)-dependent dehydrogenase (short-subunit alcohol dehydrogenase family)
VVTRAAGGIGRAIAVSLARRRCHLALADIRGSNPRPSVPKCPEPGSILIQCF